MVKRYSKYVTFAFHKYYFLFRSLNNKICTYFTVISVKHFINWFVLHFYFSYSLLYCCALCTGTYSSDGMEIFQEKKNIQVKIPSRYISFDGIIISNERMKFLIFFRTWKKKSRKNCLQLFNSPKSQCCSYVW